MAQSNAWKPVLSGKIQKVRKAAAADYGAIGRLLGASHDS